MLIHWGLAIGWEVFHPYRTLDWNRIVAKWFVLTTGLLSALSPLAVFTLFGNLVTLYFRVIETDLLPLERNSRTSAQLNADKISATMHNIKLLNDFARLLHSRFDVLIVLIVCWSFISLIAASYYLVEYTFYMQNVLGVVWDAYQMVEYYTRLVVICHSVDGIHSAVT